jgi:peptidoglycan/xylan/chitin deacetylase (PgdA/CDA1 family)
MKTTRSWAGLVLLIVSALGARSQATTYYVSSSDGNDGLSGLSPSSAWKTLAKVNASTFVPGDTILLKRGDTWREALIPPSSGTSTNVIAFDAYGVGAAPNITGYQNLTTWTLVAGNVWSAPLAATNVNNVQFGSIWGQKQSTQGAVQHSRDFYFSGNTLYVYSAGNPVTAYGNVNAILMNGSALLYVNGKNWLRFQHILLNWFDTFGVSVAGASDHLTFANMESDGMVPAGVTPLGFYVNANSPTDIKFYNDSAHLNYDGFRIDGQASAISVINCSGYANRNGGLVDNSGHTTYSYSHFYGNTIGVLLSQDVVGGISGGNNVSSDAAPAVVNWQRYPAKLTFTVDDEGKSTGGADFIDNVLPQFASRNLKMSVAVVTGEQYTATDKARIQDWFDAGHDINSHSWSHNYYTTANVFTIRYVGMGSAATMTIAGNKLTTSVTGGPGGENLNIDFTSADSDSFTEVVAAINAHAGYTASMIGLPYGHSTTLADVAAQDIKSGAYNVQLQKDRFVPDEMATSKAWLQTNIAGLSNAEVYVYPAGYEDAQTQAWAAAAGYKGARGGLSMGLGSKEVYGAGVNLQDVTSLGLSGLHGMSRANIEAKMAAFVFKASAWGVPYGVFCHPGELTAQEVGFILDAAIANGVTWLTNTQLVDWLATTNNTAGTTYYTFAATGAANDFRPTPASPVLNAGSNLGASYAIDLRGVSHPPLRAWDVGAYQHSAFRLGAGGGGSFKIGITPVVVPIPPSGTYEAQLPQQWVNTHMWDHAINTPDRVKTIKISGGDYTCNGATSVLQSALDEAENWRVAHDQDTRIDIDPSCPAFVVHGSGSQIYMKNLDGAGKYNYDKAIVLRSANPPRRGVRVGYVAVKSDYRQGGRRYVQTYDPHGLVNGDPVSIENESGTSNTNFNADENNPFLNVTVTDATHFNFAQAGPDETAVVTFPMSLMAGPNTLSQWAAGNYGGFYKLQTDGANAFPLYGQANAVTNIGPHAYVITNADVSSPTGPQLDQGLINLGTIPSNTQTTAESGWDMGVEQAYIHGCAGAGIPTTAETLPHPIPCSPQGINKSGIRMFCGNCWLADSFIDQISEEGIDTHSVGAGQAGIGPQKIVNNRLRGGSTTIHYGGTAPTIPGYNPVDLEIARNVVDLDPNWKAVSFGGQGPAHHWLLKNRIEFKTGNRILIYGNRFNYSWADGDQVGSMFLLTIRSSGQQLMLRNVTVEDNLWQKSFAFLQLLGRDDPSDGAGVSYSTQGITIRNNMITGTGDPGMTNSMGPMKIFPTGAGDWPFTCNASRANDIETLSNCSFVASGSYAAGSQKHTDMEPDDSIRTYNCTDPSLNTSMATVIASDPTTLGPITFSNPGANVTGASCTFSMSVGTPRGVRVEHNTVIAKGQGSFNLTFMNLQATTQKARNLTYRNNLLSKEGGANLVYCQSGQDGSGSGYAGKCIDTASFEFHHNAFVHTSGLNLAHYSDWNPRGTEVTSHTNTWFPANLSCGGSITAACAGFAGDYGSGFAAVDYHDFKLNPNSYFAAGHAGAADDGKDLGVDLSELDSTFTLNPYVCKTDCTSGGRNHGPWVH